MLGEQQISDEASTNQMILNDPLELRRIASVVPRAFRVHDGNGPTLANAQAVGFRAKNAARLRQPELAQTPFQEGPGRQPSFFFAALGCGLVAAQEDVPAGNRDAFRIRDVAKVGAHIRHVRWMFMPKSVAQSPKPEAQSPKPTAEGSLLRLEPLRVPLQAELARRGHVANER